MRKSIHSKAYKDLLRKLRTAREKAGLTQIEFARLVGESQSFISKCERGERRIDVIELRTFCQVLGIEIVDFVRSLNREQS